MEVWQVYQGYRQILQVLHETGKGEFPCQEVQAQETGREEVIGCRYVA